MEPTEEELKAMYGDPSENAHVAGALPEDGPQDDLSQDPSDAYGDVVYGDVDDE